MYKWLWMSPLVSKLNLGLVCSHLKLLHSTVSFSKYEAFDKFDRPCSELKLLFIREQILCRSTVNELPTLPEWCSHSEEDIGFIEPSSASSAATTLQSQELEVILHFICLEKACNSFDIVNQIFQRGTGLYSTAPILNTHLFWVTDIYSSVYMKMGRLSAWVQCINLFAVSVSDVSMLIFVRFYVTSPRVISPSDHASFIVCLIIVVKVLWLVVVLYFGVFFKG